MQIDLSDLEVQELKSAMEHHLHDLRVELAHTDNRTCRRELRATLERLETISQRLAEI